jgi:selenocysteine-specific elongation factor
VWRERLERLVHDGAVEFDDDRVARGGRHVVLSESAALLAEQVEARFREAWLDPPDLQAINLSAAPRETALIVDWLVKQQRLVRIRDGRLFHAEALQWLRQRLSEYGRASRTMDVAAFKQLAGVTRKNAIPLLEQFDAERLTRRVGNLREILISTGS